MGEGVIADEVSGGADAAGEVAAVADETSDEEEGGADVVAGEDVEQLFGAGVVGTVVVGEGVFDGVAAGEECSAEDLRGGPDGGVVVASNGEAGGSSCGGDGGEHCD